MGTFNLQRGGDTLILNCDGKPLSMLPLSTLTWREAIVNMVKENVTVLEEYEDWVISSPSISIKVPSVVMSKHWVPSGRSVRFSSTNVYVRDDFTCQYCNMIFPVNQLTKDHVIPKVLGGRVTWDNIACACVPCNQKKSHHLDMKPIRVPRKPTYGELLNKLKKQPIYIRHPTWQQYVDWPEENIRLINTGKT